MTTTTIAAGQTVRLSWLKAMPALLLGFGMLYFIGFSPISAAHEAAHDWRHSMNFPCH
jgi:cobalt transporter subunit CbtB